MAKQLNVSLSFNADTAKAKTQIQDLQNTLNQLVKGSAATASSKGSLGITKDLMEAQVAATKLQTILNQSMNQKTGNLDLTKFSESFNKAGMKLETLKGQLDLLGPTGQKAFMSLASSIVSADVPLKRTNALVSELWTTMKNTARWQLSSSVLHGFMGTIQSATGYARDLDESLNNIRIVTGQSAEQMAAFADRANKAAKALSTTTTEYTNASLIYYQQGLSDSEVQDRADITIKMAHASGQSAEIVSDQLTAVWNNFYDGSKSLEHYADVMTALGAATASSSDEIAGGLEKFASIADMIGLSYEYAASALATITATTRQSEDVVGTALKTIFARIQGLSLGETLEDGTNLNKYSEALQKVGISIYEQNGELKDMDNILNEMGAKWETLSKDQQVALAQTVAGVRQYNQLVSLMDNWDFFESNLDIANSSDGALQEQADIYAESWQAARDRVKAAAQDIYDSILDPDFFITLLNGFEKLLSVIANFSDSLNGLPGVLSLLGTILTKVFSEQLANSINRIAFNVKSLTGETQKASDKMRDEAMELATDLSFQSGTKSGNMEGQALKDRLVLQNQIREVSENLTAEEKEQLSTLLNINDAYSEQAILAAQMADKTSDKVQESRGDIRSSIRKASEGDEEIMDMGLQELSDATSRMKEINVVGLNAAEAISKINAELTITAKSADGFEAEIDQICAGLEEVGRPKAAEKVRQLVAEFKNTGDVEKFKQELAEVVTEEDMLSDTSARASEELSQLQRDFNITGQQAQDYANDLLANEQATRNANRAAEAYESQLAKLKGEIAGFSGAMDSFGKNVVTTANGISSLLTAFNAFKGIWETLNNPDLSGGEKVLSIMTSLTMAIPALVFGLSALNKEQLKKNVADLVAIKNGAIKIVQDGAQIILTKVKTAVQKGETAAIWGTVAAKIADLAATAPLLLITLALVAAIAALVAVSWLIVKAFNAWKASTPEGKLDALKDKAEKSAEAFNRVQESVNATKAAIESLDESYDTIDNLIEGTQEWRDAINDANTQVLNLLDNYPALANYITTDSESGLMQLSDEGVEYLNKENASRLNAANRLKINDQIAVSEQEVQNSYADFAGVDGAKGSLNDAWAEALQEYYNAVGDAAFTDAGAESLMKTFQEGGYGTGLTQDNFKAILENNKKLLQDNAAKQKSIDLLTDLNLESQFRDLGSTRSADQIKDLIGDTTYEDIKSQKLNETKQSFGDWNNKIDYKESDAEWGMIQDFMNLQGDNVEYVAQRKGKMVLEVNGEEIEYSKDEVYDALSELYTAPELQDRLETGLKDTLRSSIGNAVENLDVDQLTNLDNVKSDIVNALIGDIDAEEMSADQFAAEKEKATSHGEELFSGMMNAYSQTEGSMESGLEAFQDDTEYIDANSEAFLRQAEALNAGKISAEEFTSAIRELNAEGQIAAMGDYFANAAEQMGLGAEEAGEMQAYAEHLRSIAKDSEMLADSLAEDAESAADLAVEVTRLNKGVDALAEGFEEWGDILKKSSKESQEYFKAMSKTKEALADVLDVEKDLISDDFVANHLDEIAQAAQGNEEAIDSLRGSMDEEMVARITLGQTDEFIAKIQALDAEVQANVPEDIEVGAVLQDGAFYDAAARMVEEAEMTADEANAYFAGMGYEPVYETTDIPGGNTMQSPNAVTTVAMTGITWSQSDVSIGDHQIPIKAPAFKIETRSTPLPPVDDKADVRLTSWSGGEKAPPLKGLRKKAPGSMNNSSSKNSGGAPKGNGSGNSGGGGSSKKATPTKKSDIIERYKPITDLIDDVTDSMEDASKAADRLYGSARIRQMKAVNNLLQTEVGYLRDKRAEAEKYMAEEDLPALQKSISEFDMEFTFDDRGNISNYDAVMGELFKQLSETETAAGDEWDEGEQEKIDTLKEKIEKVKEAISQYDETRELMEDIDNEIQDKLYEWQDNNYEILQYELELKIDIDDAKLKKLDYFINKFSDDFYRMGDAVEKMVAKAPNFEHILNTYISEDRMSGYIVDLKNAYDAGEISQEAYIEGLKESRDAIYEQLENLIELDKEMLHFYEDTLSAASEELEDYTDHMEHLNGVFDHYINLSEILGKQKDWVVMGDFLSGKASITRDQLDVAKEYYQVMLDQQEDIKKQLDSAKRSGSEEDIRYWQEQWDAIVDATDEAQEQVLSLTEEWAESMKAIFENDLASAFDALEKSLTGNKGFEKLLDDFDKLNLRQEEFLTKTNQIYETNKLMRTANKALDETDNKVAKQKLKNFIDETKGLQETTQLSQYELEIQQAKYDLLLAEIALEEAQNAKATVRLSRDNEGNFGYVYTADQDAVADAQQGLEDAENNLYNISLEGQQNYTEKYLQAHQQMLDDMKAVTDAYAEGEITSKEEVERRLAEIQEHYYGIPNGILTTYSNLYNVAVRTDANATADYWGKEYGEMTQHTEVWKEKVTICIADINTATEAWEKVSEQANQDVADALENSADKTKDLTDESENLKNMINDEVIPAIEDELEAVADQIIAYGEARDAILEMIAAYEDYLELLDQEIEATAGLTYDKNTDYSALMAGFLAAGGSKDSVQYRALEAQREAKIVGEDLDKEYYGSKVGDPDYDIKSDATWYKDKDEVNAKLKELGISTFASGGYSGDWGPEGKLAILHEKELVLNRDDTDNLLRTVSFIREIISSIDSQASMAGLFNMTASRAIDTGNSLLEQSVTIHAEFPNATNHNEIEEAFNNLVNRAAQYANRK